MIGHLLIGGLATYVGSWCFTSWYRDASLTLGRLVFLVALAAIAVTAAVTAPPAFTADMDVPAVKVVVESVGAVADLGLLLGVFGLAWGAGHASAA